MTVLINGQTTDRISVRERSFQYGDGLFETMAVIDGICPFWDRHMQRLQKGCQQLQLPFPDRSLLRAEAQVLIQNERRAVLKLILSRGEGGRGYVYSENVPPSRIFMRYPWPEYPKQNGQAGVQVRFCNTTLARQPALAGLKHLNRLEQVIARNEWRDGEIAEGLMLDENENVIEGTMSNLFMVQNKRLYTADLSRCGVAGIMRGYILDLARNAGIAIHIGDISKQQLGDADEIFLSNSLIGLWPVNRLEGQLLAVGEISRRLQTLINRDYPHFHA
ncbi:Aminodeoxychorismate lyase [hydrothermal vent metagenome]|uniref:aminodeoxychorismate lyase n=1 Tax=hydrothermal vent metagenome TaxID=652676 RepID=A0A3B1B1V5_9ZZZZ